MQPLTLPPARTLRPAARAFTIVELLVVLTIMSTLVALLMPAIAAARRQAQSTLCKANQRQVLTAFHGYALDNKEFWPEYSYTTNSVPTWNGQTPGGPVTLMWWSFKYVGPYINNTSIASSAYTNGLRCDSSVIACPSTPYYASIKIGTGSSTGVGYNNVWDNKIVPSKLGPTKTSRFAWPHRTVITLDTRSASAWNNWITAEVTIDAPSYARHDGFCNASFADGHVTGFAPQVTGSSIATEICR